MSPRSLSDGISRHAFRFASNLGVTPRPRADFYPGKAFRWLSTPWHHPYWDVITVRKKPSRIRWDRRLPDGRRLTDPYHADLLETLRIFCAILMEDPFELMDLNHHSTAIGRVQRLLVVVDWLIARGLTRFADIGPSDLEHFKTTVHLGADILVGREEPAEGSEPLVDSVILEYFRVLQHLYDFHATQFDDGSLLLPDGLLDNPFPSPGDAITLARMLGTAAGKTRTIPPHVSLYTLNAAIEWVMYHSQEILALLAKAKHEAARIDLEELRFDLRPTSDEACHRVAQLIRELMKQPSTIPLMGSKISRPPLAARTNLSLSTLYRNQICADMLAALQAYSDERGKRSPSQAKERLNSLIRPWLDQPPRAREDRVDQIKINQLISKSIGLPFSGSTMTKGGPWPIQVFGSNPHGKPSLEQATNNLWSACFVVIAAFMADRIEEVLETEVDCLDLNRPEGPYFKNKTWKDTNADSGLESARPCPQIVVEAVQVLLELGAVARSETGSQKLFMADHRLGSSVADQATTRKRLKSFCGWIGIPAAEAEDLWSIAPHQLRRFFVQAFTWHYEIGADLLALKQHLRQADVATVARYAMSVMRGEMVSDEQKALTVHVMEKAAFEGLELQGNFGAHLMRLFNRLKVRVGSPEQLSTAIKRYQSKSKILLRPNPWGYCAWSLSRARFAQCAKEAGVGNPAGPVDSHRTATCCGRCLNFVTHTVFAQFWRESTQRFQRMLAVPGLSKELAEAAEVGLALSLRYSTTG